MCLSLLPSLKISLFCEIVDLVGMNMFFFSLYLFMLLRFKDQQLIYGWISGILCSKTNPMLMPLQQSPGFSSKLSICLFNRYLKIIIDWFMIPLMAYFYTYCFTNFKHHRMTTILYFPPLYPNLFTSPEVCYQVYCKYCTENLEIALL